MMETTVSDRLHGDGSESSNPHHYTLPQYHGDDTLHGGGGNDTLEGDSRNTPHARHDHDWLDSGSGSGQDKLQGDASDHHRQRQRQGRVAHRRGSQRPPAGQQRPRHILRRKREVQVLPSTSPSAVPHGSPQMKGKTCC